MFLNSSEIASFNSIIIVSGFIFVIKSKDLGNFSRGKHLDVVCLICSFLILESD